MQAETTIGLIGKHPGYGDFLQWGLSEATVAQLTQWMDASLPSMRDQMEETWDLVWDGALDLRFWIGRAVLGTTLVGVFRASRDKVGRRYPLLLLQESAAVDAPLVAQDQTPWEGIEAHMKVMQAGQGAQALVKDAALEIATETEDLSQIGPTLWAHHPEGNLEALLSRAAQVDAQRAQLSRSYWWSPGDAARAPVWLGCHGLPSAQSLAWLLGGVLQEARA